MSDIRNAKMCARGTRAFFMLHGLDFQDFLKNGIDAEKILSTKDAMAIQVVELKYGRQ
ncbi:hypothetical protein [Acinetobacter bereziniae]|nr:hypothetical protein [Acinetobacter bereziniae]